MQLVVGRIAKAHGIGGEVAVEVRTDDVEHRFATGATLKTDPAANGPLVVERSRWHSGRLLVRFAGVADRTAAEGLRNTMLVADSETSLACADANEFWDHELIGLAAHTADGAPLGEVTDVVHPPGPDLLVIAGPDGAEVLVPFVAAIVPTVDLAGRRIVVDPPDGLLDL
jgi:16S rRNA processing protein RimM